MSPKAAALLLLPTFACAVGPKYSPPQIPVPRSWNEAMPTTTANAESLARWWAEFQDATLDRLVKEAVEGNLDLRLATARIREARAARGIAASAGLPQVAVGAAYARTQRSEAVPPFKSTPGINAPFGPREQNVFEAGFDASWELDVFGGV
jgi:outer membrane protein TolC